VITPDQLAAQLTPPAGTGAAYAAQLYLSEGATDLAERIIDATEPGPQQQAALAGLVHVLETAYAGVDPAVALPLPCTPVPYALTGQADAGPDPVLLLDVGVWRLGLRMSRMHPLTRLAGLVLADACGPSGCIADANQPTLRDLSDQTGLPMNQLHTHLQDLVTGHWVSRHVSVNHAVRRSLFQLRLPNPFR
jgi:hypothetical protein